MWMTRDGKDRLEDDSLRRGFRTTGEILIVDVATLCARARLLVDILSMKLFVWMLGHNGELLDSHLFFFDRYSELAEFHRLKGRTAKAERLAAIAEAYDQAAPDDDEPPEAAAMAMPVPLPAANTNAVSTARGDEKVRKGIVGSRRVTGTITSTPYIWS
jgi:hypothetical protein